MQSVAAWGGRALAWGRKGGSLGKEGRRLGEDVWPSGVTDRPGAGQAGGGALGRPGGSRASMGEQNMNVLSFFSFSFFCCCGLVLASGVDGGN